MSFVKTRVQTEAVKLLGGASRHTLLFGGARSGKTFILIRSIVIRAFKEAGSRHCILRKYLVDLQKSVVCATFPVVMEKCFPAVPYSLNKNMNYICFPNGSEIWFGGLDNGDKILGNEYATLFFNECSELSYSQVELACSRNAQKCAGIENRFYYDENPVGKAHWSYKLFVEKRNPADNTPLLNPENYASMRMNPADNLENLSATYMESLNGMGARHRARFRDGEWQDDNENALWKRDGMINPYRVAALPAALDRVVVGVDPAATGKETSDLTGIVIASCKRIRGEVHYFVLDDRSLRGTPNEWASAVVNAFREYEADRVVAEVNQGGDMVEQTLRNIDRRIAYRGVRATRGKLVRAEPIAALYERGLVHHVGEFPLLEDEMCNYCGYENEKSPDRMDALVWALTELSRSSGASYPILAQ